MNKQIIKVGIVGSGFAARFHFEALRRVFSANIKVVGAYSPNRERLDSFTSERSIQSFSSLEDLIDACDVLHLCTPPVTHEPMAIEILNRDKSVVIEKPLTGYFGDGNQLFNGDTFSRETGYRKAVESIQRMIDAEKKSKGKILYAENWVYAVPSISTLLTSDTNVAGSWIISQTPAHIVRPSKNVVSNTHSNDGETCHPQ